MKIADFGLISVGAMIILLLAACVGGHRVTQPEGTRSIAKPGLGTSSDPAPAERQAGTEMAKLRSVLTGEPLTDEEVRFLHEALQRAKMDYTQNGLLTYAEWELRARVTVETEGKWRLFVEGHQVNADWELFVDRETGEVEEGWQGTILPIPDSVVAPPS